MRRDRRRRAAAARAGRSPRSTRPATPPHIDASHGDTEMIHHSNRSMDMQRQL